MTDYRSPLAVLAVTVTLTGGPANLIAQSPTRGQVIASSAVIWRLDVAVPAATAKVGTLLEVTAQSTRWYEVIVPEALGGRGERGLIARSQVQIVGDAARIPTRTLRGDPPPGTAPTQAPERTAPPPNRAQQPGQRPRSPGNRTHAVLSVNGMINATARGFGETVAFRENEENSTFDTSYTLKTSRGFGVGGAVMLTPTFGVGGSIERATTNTPASFEADIPHPFLFGTPRQITATIGGLRREELIVHGELRAMWPLSRRVEFALMGGPSLFRVRQDVVSDFFYADAYPYDEASFLRSEELTATNTKIGFNVGADAVFYATRRVGVGAKVAFSRARVRLRVADDREPRVDAGGLSTGVGLRVKF